MRILPFGVGLEVLISFLRGVRLCVAVIIALPIATPKERMNDAGYALGTVTNLSGWPTGFAFILSMQAVHWTIGYVDGKVHHEKLRVLIEHCYSGYDCAVHISEEASNAAVAVPYAIAGAIFIAGVLGTGTFPCFLWGWLEYVIADGMLRCAAVNISLAFCMGNDLEGLVNGSIGQPMAQIFYNSFGKGPTLGLWIVIVLVQYTMGSSAVSAPVLRG